MNSASIINAGSTENKNSNSFTCNKEMCENNDKFVDFNTSYRLHLSHGSSTLSNDSDLSISALSIDRELSLYSNRIIDSDELPAFEIRLISPQGRTPSPIDSDLDSNTPTKSSKLLKPDASSIIKNNSDFVTLQDINAQISPPSDNEDSLNRSSSLETIFEGVFLQTPPRQRRSLNCRRSLMERVAINRVHYGKENATPPHSNDKVPKNEDKLGKPWPPNNLR